MSERCIFKVVGHHRGRLRLAEMPVLKETPNAVEVERCEGSGYLKRLDKGACHFTPEDAIIDERRLVADLKHEWERRARMLDELRAEVYGDTASQPSSGEQKP